MTLPAVLGNAARVFFFPSGFFPTASLLQDIASDFPRGEESLRRLEEQAGGVIQSSSPLGAEKITRELEEMRNVLEKLRALWEGEEGRLRGLLWSREAYEQQRRQLEAELAEFRKGLQRLAEEDLEPAAKAGTQDELVARWRLYSVSSVWQSRGPVRVPCVRWGICAAGGSRLVSSTLALVFWIFDNLSAPSTVDKLVVCTCFLDEETEAWRDSRPPTMTSPASHDELVGK